MRHALLIIAASFILAEAAGNADAATVSANLVNSITVTGNCSLSTSGFSTSINPTDNQAVDISASITTTCTAGASANVTLGQGAYAESGSTNAAPLRRLSNGALTPTFLRYALYSDSNRSTMWGNTSQSGVTVVGTGTAVSQTVYARILSGQTNVGSGAYSDTVVATITF